MSLAKRVFLDDANSKYQLDYLSYDTVWFVIDTDTWASEGKIATLRSFCQNNNSGIVEKYSEVKTYPAWRVVQSNPSFEIWLYYHILSGIPNQEVVDSYPTFKAFVGSAISGGFNFQSDPVKVDKAVENSKATFKRDDVGELALYSTEVYELAEVIVPLVKPQLARLKGKMK